MSANMQFVTELVSKTGGREINEDFCGFLELGEAACWVVADGLGGYQGGDAAARIAVEAALGSFKTNPRLAANAMQAHLQAAQQAVLQAQKTDPRLSTMRTTIVVLITDSKRSLWAHVGDSRLYCFENGRIVFCTSDHSVVQAMVDAGKQSPDQVRHNEDRNRLLRCLGNPGAQFRPTILQGPRPLTRSTSFLLCTDGFWENITESEMEVDFTKAEASGEWLRWMTDRVMDHVTEKSDNYTAVVVAIAPTSTPVSPSISSSPQAATAQIQTKEESPLTRTSLFALSKLLSASVPILRTVNWFLFSSLKAVIRLHVQSTRPLTAQHTLL